MVESTPPAVYDAIEVYRQQGLSEISGHFMLLQAEMNRKKQAAKEDISEYGIALGSLAPVEIKNAHRLYKLHYKVEHIFYDMTGNHVMDEVYGGKCRNGTYYTFFSLMMKAVAPVVARQSPVSIMTNNVRQRGAEDAITARSQEAKRASEARAGAQESRIAQIHETMLQQQEHMQL
jgi:hypothetical protein